MRKVIYLFIIATLAAGCLPKGKSLKRLEDVKIEEKTYDKKAQAMREDFLRQNQKNLSDLPTSISKAEATAIMRAEMDKFPVWLQTLNPYKSETLTIGGERYRIVYYYTQTKVTDGSVSDDELTPLVFKQDEFLGAGYRFLCLVFIEAARR
jgi:hypothetical protein